MILFPMLHRRYGTIPLLRSVKLVFPACFISLPIIGIFTHAVSGDGKTGNEKSSLIAMVGIILSLGLKCFGNMSMGQCFFFFFTYLIPTSLSSDSAWYLIYPTSVYHPTGQCLCTKSSIPWNHQWFGTGLWLFFKLTIIESRTRISSDVYLSSFS